MMVRSMEPVKKELPAAGASVGQGGGGGLAVGVRTRLEGGEGAACGRKGAGRGGAGRRLSDQV